MKKSFTLLCFILFFTYMLPCYGQLKVGLKGGMVLSSLVRDSHLNARDGTLGYLVGLTGKYNLGELGWYVQSGVQFSHEGDHGQPLDFVKVPLTIGLDVSEDISLYVDYNFAWQVGTKNGVQDFYKTSANILGLGFSFDATKNIIVGSTLNYGLSNLVSVPIEAKNFTIKPFTLDLYLTWYFLQ